VELLVEVFADCPACGEPMSLEIDTSIEEQSYFEDCPVCCRPLEIFVRSRPGEVVSLSATAE
jgi:hypothetical protein